MGRLPVLKDKVYINFWAEREVFDRVNSFAAKYSVTRSEILRTGLELGLEGIDSEMLRRQGG